MVTESPSPSSVPLPAWVLLLDRWKSIVGATLVVGILAFAGSFLVPQTFRVRSSLFVLPPASAQNLKLPPDRIHVSTLQTLAMAPSLLEALIEKLQDQHILVEQVEAKVRSEGGQPDQATWEERLSQTASAAAVYLGAEPTPAFEAAWEDLPPAELILGYHDFEEGDFKDKDALALTQRLSASILTSLETNVTTDFQPILNLEVEWESKQSAALIADVWARTISRYSDRVFLEPTLNLQTHRIEQLAGFERELSEIGRRRANLLAEVDLEATKARFDSVLAQLYGRRGETVQEASPTSALEAKSLESGLLRTALESQVTRDALEVRVRYLQTVLDLLEVNGDWVGNLSPKEFLADPTIRSRVAQLEGGKVGKSLSEDESAGLRLLESVRAVQQDLASQTAIDPPASPGSDPLEAPLAILRREYQQIRSDLQAARDSLEQVRGEAEILKSRQDGLYEEALRIGHTLGETRAALKGLDVKQQAVQAAHERVLKQGGLEARVTDFNEVLKLRKSPSPMLPEKPYRPRHWLFGIVASLLAAVLVSTWIVLKDRYALAKSH